VPFAGFYSRNRLNDDFRRPAGDRWVTKGVVLMVMVMVVMVAYDRVYYGNNVQ